MILPGIKEGSGISLLINGGNPEGRAFNPMKATDKKLVIMPG